MLDDVSNKTPRCVPGKYVLEVVQRLLPCTVQLHPDLDAAKDLLLSAFKVDPQLQDIAIVEGIRLALHARCRQSDVIQECAARALDVLDIPLPALAPELAVSPRDHLGAEPHRCHRVVEVLLGRPADLDLLVLLAEGALDGSKVE